MGRPGLNYAPAAPKVSGEGGKSCAGECAESACRDKFCSAAPKFIGTSDTPTGGARDGVCIGSSFGRVGALGRRLDDGGTVRALRGLRRCEDAGLVVWSFHVECIKWER